jgi:endonuclease YncB( thermonuclease family)
LNRNLFLLFLLFGLILTGCATAVDNSGNALRDTEWYSVADYIDGDTFKIHNGDSKTTIRLLYVDTPETNGSTPEPFGPEASAFTKQLLQESGEVKLTFDEEPTDRYNRTLAVVELRNGKILNELLLEEGLAKVLIVEPNVKMENVYKQLEQLAKQNKRGIWKDAANTSNSDIRIEKTLTAGIRIEVNKAAELVTITNTTDEPIVMNGWKLVSVRGNQTYPFGKYVLEARSQVIISSADDAETTKNKNRLDWGAVNIWNNQESDPAELYNNSNELVAVWEDE